MASGVPDDGRPTDGSGTSSEQGADKAKSSTFHIVSKKKEAPKASFSPLRLVRQLSLNTSLFYQGVGWRGYDNYIGARVFVPDLTVRIKKQVLSSPRVAQAVADYAGTPRYGGKSASALRGEAARMLDGLAGDLSDKRAGRFMVYVVNNLLIRMYHQGIHVNESQFARVKAVATEAADKGLPLIFLPCHKSHMDYILLGYLFYRLGISMPFIASGDNLNMPVVGTLLRRCGAFFHRRSFADDPLYTAVFKEYVETLLSMGHNIEAFVEGTRSRTGKLLNPKLGILKIITEAVLSGRVKDAYICPISIGYDKVLETESYVNELLGAEKQQESLSQLLNSTRVLALKWGRIDVRFAAPFSLQSYIASQKESRGADFRPAADREHQAVLLKSLAYQVLLDINSEFIIMPSGLIGTVLLTLRGRGIGRSDLIKRVEWLRDEIVERGGHVADFGPGETPAIVDRTIAVLSGLAGERKNLLEPVLYVAKRFELSYYRNELIHLFMVDSIVCCSLYSCMKQSGSVYPERRATRTMLLAQTEFLSQMMKFEFIFPPGRVAANLEAALAYLARKQVLSFDNESVGIADAELSSGRENFDFYCFLLWPFIETYWLAAVSLHAMPDSGLVIESVFMDRCQKFASTMYYEGDLSYFESINKETLKNAYSRLQEMGVIERKKVDRYVVLALQEPFARDNKAALKDLVEAIGRFRREGKNRRDNANTSDRTLRLASLMSMVEARL